MNRQTIATCAVALMFGTLSNAAEAETPIGLEDTLFGGMPHFNLRYRYEHVSDDSFTQDANASTLRLRLNYATRKWYGWSGFTEIDYVAEAILKDFDSGAGTSSSDRNRFPTIADPKGADLNQLYLDYEGIANTRFRFGRQRILLDDQRFVGGVGWRQNEQTYDGVSGVFKGLPRLELFYSYITQVDRIFGERSTAGRHDVNSHLLNGRIDISNKWQVTPYYYYIDNDDSATFSTSTAGVRITGEIDFGQGKLAVHGAVATQSDIANNPNDYDATYYHLSADWGVGNNLSLDLGAEVLGGDQNASGNAFRTPLATLHLFQGWADQFLSTPDAGIEDLYFGAKYKYQDWSFQATYHDFSAADGSASWGSEFDLSASRNLGNRYSLLLKAAIFNADDAPFSDTNKFWIQLIANY